MSIINDVLREELNSNIEKEKFYNDKIKDLPKGSLSRKNTHGNFYYYLVYREGAKVKTDYLGKLSDKEIEELDKKIKYRRRLQTYLRKVKKNIKYLRRLLNVNSE